MFSPSGLYELVDTLWKRGQSLGLLVGAIVGALVGSWISWTVSKHWMPSLWKGKFENLNEERALLMEEKRVQLDRLEDLSKECMDLRELNAHYVIQTKSAESGLDRASNERDQLQRSIATIQEHKVRIEANLSMSEAERTALQTELKSLRENARKGWDHPPGEASPRFRSLHARRMPIISVVNLKGGVGKTTITANLGAMLAKEEGLRVLMVDLDYQGSLSSLCLSSQELQDVRQSRRFVEDVIRNETKDRARAVFHCATRLEDIEAGRAFLLATEESLDAVESEIMAPWLLRISNDDVRFRLREALHSPAIQEEYDIVLLDCPPRLSTACVNALAASDFVLIPVIPETTSTEATPRLLHWIRKFQSSFSPELAILGVVANRVTLHLGNPIARQQDIWNQLKDQCRKAWGQDIRFFDEAMIPRFNGLAHRLAALSPGSSQAVIKDLANIILKELSPYARRRTTTVHPLPHPASPSIRS